jgi:hypothetical protein
MLSLWLFDNQVITGQIPSEIGNLLNLSEFFWSSGGNNRAVILLEVISLNRCVLIFAHHHFGPVHFFTQHHWPSLTRA